MESSALKAIELGVSTFIFVIALTMSIILLTNVLNMSEIVANISKADSTSSLLEYYGQGKSRTYSWEEIMALAYKYEDVTTGLQNEFVLYINNNGNKVMSINNVNILDKTKEYNIVYNGKQDSKLSYVFKEVETK